MSKRDDVGYRMAWPERVVLFLFVAVIVLVAEYCATGAIVILLGQVELSICFAAAAVFIDLWALLRTVDWLFAGPARRRKDRVIKFSP